MDDMDNLEVIHNASNEPCSDVESHGKSETEKIMKYNDDEVYNKHLKLFLDQTESELEQAAHKTKGTSLVKKNDVVCPICPKKFKLKNRLDLHIRKSHIKNR